MPLGDRSYAVLIGPGLLDEVGARMRSLGLDGAAAIVTDDSVGALYGTRVQASLEGAGYAARLYAVAPGEGSKSLATLENLAERLAADGHDRGSVVVALGGGVVGDLAGFLAATYQRGVPWVQLPTSVMAQVDSSVGGKTGVNLRAGKNLVGAFHQPRLVLADTDTLATLGKRQANEGFAEVIKYGVIRRPALLEALLGRASVDLPAIVEGCVQIKAEIVGADEHERGGDRALLNFGHTIGHAIEAEAGYGGMFHGEAVALGMRAAAFLSTRRAGFSEGAAGTIDAALRRYDLPAVLPADLSPERIVRRAFSDKKFVAGTIRFVLASRLGHAFISDAVTRDDLADAVAFLRQPVPLDPFP